MTPVWAGHDISKTALIEWLTERLPDQGEPNYGNCQVLAAVDRQGEVAGVVVFHHYDPVSETMELTVAGQGNWLNRTVLRAILDYAFSACQMIFARFPSDRKSRTICQKFGASEVTIPRLLGRQVDGVIATLTREQWDAHHLR